MAKAETSQSQLLTVQSNMGRVGMRAPKFRESFGLKMQGRHWKPVHSGQALRAQYCFPEGSTVVGDIYGCVYIHVYTYIYIHTHHSYMEDAYECKKCVCLFIYIHLSVLHFCALCSLVHTRNCCSTLSVSLCISLPSSKSLGLGMNPLVLLRKQQ